LEIDVTGGLGLHGKKVLKKWIKPSIRPAFSFGVYCAETNV